MRHIHIYKYTQRTMPKSRGWFVAKKVEVSLRKRRRFRTLI